MKIPTLHTERTLLRPFSMKDLKALATIFAKPDVMKFMPGGRPRSLEETETTLKATLQHWFDHGFGWWAIEEKQDHALLGWCGLSYLDGTKEVELLYLVDQPYWGRGFARETARASLDYGFNQLGLKSIAAVAVPENLASRRVMEKLGMQYRGPKHCYNSDLAYYSITAEEFV